MVIGFDGSSTTTIIRISFGITIVGCDDVGLALG